MAGLIEPRRLIDWSDEAFRALSAGRANVPLRSELLRKNPDGVVLAMPALLDDRYLGVKVIGSVAAEACKNATTCLMLIWDAVSLRPLGLMSADAFNEHRTAAGLAAATRALARPDSTVHAIFGAGKLAFTAALYVAQVRPIGTVILVSRTPERVRKLAARLRADKRLAGIQVVTGLDRRSAVERANVITTVTTSSSPVFDGNHVRPGTHINLGGAFRPDARETDDAVALRASFWLDDARSCLERAGDLVMPLRSGALQRERIKGEIGAVLNGNAAGRTSSEEITVFKSLGIAVQDVALGAHLLRAAEAAGAGTLFDDIAG